MTKIWRSFDIFLQSVEAILSMYGESIPIRFGILLYSSKMIKCIEENGGGIDFSANSCYDSGDDVSTLVIYFHDIFCPNMRCLCWIMHD